MEVTESIPQKKEDLPPAKKDQNSTSFKIEANLDELEVNITTVTKPVANIQIKGRWVRKVSEIHVKHSIKKIRN